MMQEMIVLLKNKGYEKVFLSVNKDNYAYRMYQKLGFQVLREQGKCFIEYIQAEFAWVPIEADNGIGLWYRPFEETVDVPGFRECAAASTVYAPYKRLRNRNMEKHYK